MQILDQKYSFDIFDAPRLYDGLTAAVYKFLNWFATAQRHLNGRDLAEFEVVTGDGTERLAMYRSFLPIGRDEPGREAARHVGVVPEATLHFFANGYSSVTKSGEGAVIILVESSGRGRTLALTSAAVDELLHLTRLNARSEWAAAEPLGPPDIVEAKGRDFVGTEVQIVAYDPSSRTVFVTYLAQNQKVVQVNMPPGVLMALYAQLVETAG